MTIYEVLKKIDINNKLLPPDITWQRNMFKEGICYGAKATTKLAGSPEFGTYEAVHWATTVDAALIVYNAQRVYKAVSIRNLAVLDDMLAVPYNKWALSSLPAHDAFYKIRMIPGWLDKNIDLQQLDMPVNGNWHKWKVLWKAMIKGMDEDEHWEPGFKVPTSLVHDYEISVVKTIGDKLKVYVYKTLNNWDSLKPFHDRTASRDMLRALYGKKSPLVVSDFYKMLVSQQFPVNLRVYLSPMMKRWSARTCLVLEPPDNLSELTNNDELMNLLCAQAVQERMNDSPPTNKNEVPF
jgi:hypothetical protein